MKILMVCLGNICRSPLAEGILKDKSKHLDITIDSAGTAGYHIGSAPDFRSVEIAQAHGIDITQQRARQVNSKDFQEFDLIYAMDKQNYSNLISLASNEKERNKVKMILNEVNENKYESVPDPYYGIENGFEKVFSMLEDACEKIILNIG